MRIVDSFSRRIPAVLMVSVVLSAMSGCGGDAPVPPVARVEAHAMTIHGDTRVDNYYWLNQREDPEVLDYLRAENTYLAAMTKDTQERQNALFEEMKGRIKKDDSSAPYQKDGYWYYTRYVTGGEYGLHCRRLGTMTAVEEVMLDGNDMGRGLGYFALAGVRVSPDTKQLVYGVDTSGRRLYALHFKDLATGELADETIPGTTGNVAWANDNKILFYGRQDPETLRSYQIWRHELGTEATADVLVYEEEDETFSCYVSRAKSGRYLFVTMDQTLSSETRFLSADDPTGEFEVFQPRQKDVEYHVYHQDNRFLILTNLHAPNFRLMECTLDKTWLAQWREMIPHRTDVLLDDVEVFADWLVLSERFGGLSHLRVVAMDGSSDEQISFRDPTWASWVAYNPQLKTDQLRFGYESLTTPTTTFAYDMRTGEREVIKQDEVLGGFAAANYISEYLQVPARDGKLVPVSLVYRQGFEPDGTAPLLLYAYGSYGYSMNAGFDDTRLSLLDRGFVYAIAHIRGGQELGRQWYEDGKLLHKMNTFTDFIDCGEYLVAQQYTSRDRLFAAGGSAGGLLMGSVVNMAPDLWRGVYAAVPFVDVVTTMLDETIPLTTGEYDEWGNPHEKVYYDYMLSYSPYDQVTAQDYPALLVTTGLHDSQVQYFEPAKWVAKLRALKTDQNPLLFKINMEAGHGGKSGRFRRLEERALEFAFFLDLAGR